MTAKNIITIFDRTGIDENIYSHVSSRRAMILVNFVNFNSAILAMHVFCFAFLLNSLDKRHVVFLFFVTSKFVASKICDRNECWGTKSERKSRNRFKRHFFLSWPNHFCPKLTFCSKHYIRLLIITIIFIHRSLFYVWFKFVFAKSKKKNSC